MSTSPQNSYQKARKVALSLLARRRHSGAEIRRKLFARGFESADIERVVEACERFDYIDDEVTASFFVEELVRKQVGVNRIRAELGNRGFAPDLIHRVMDEHQLQERELDIARRAMEKKALSIQDGDRRKKREKLIRFLRSRGFRSSTISALFDRSGAYDGP